MNTKDCPNCEANDIEVFYRTNHIPIHDVVLLKDRNEAIQYPKRDLELGYCNQCGFVFNTIFDKSVFDYNIDYEETQGYSATFSNFHRKLAKRLIEKYDLKNKTVIEIGCGKGEFLTLLCEMGGNLGYGFDPAFKDDRIKIKNCYREKLESELQLGTKKDQRKKTMCTYN